MKESKFKIIDSVMGSGKSTYAINHINDNIAENFIVVVPTKSEQQRYKETLDRDVFLPTLDDGNDRLLHSFYDAVKKDRTIVTTHRLLECWDTDTVREISRRNYTLMLDEVIEVVNPVSIKQDDFGLLFGDYVTVEEVSGVEGIQRIKALEGREYDGKLHRFIEQVKRNDVFRVNDEFYVWQASPDKLQAFDSVVILTYLFHGQQLKCWFDIHEIPYSLHSVEDGKLIDYQSPSGLDFKELVTIDEEQSRNRPYNRHGSLSASYYKTAKSGTLRTLQNNTRAFFRSVCDTEPSDNLVTTFKEFESEMLREPFQFSRSGVKRSQLRTMTDQKKAEVYCFLPYNARATNMYAHKTSVAYLVNVFPRPEINSLFSCYLKDHNEKLFNDVYALSTLIQFIWRSCIRKDEPIKVYIPSKRMRELFKSWLNGDTRLSAIAA